MQFFLSLMVILVAISACTAVHYEVIRHFDAAFRVRQGLLRKHVPVVVAVIVLAHLLEIGIFALAFWFSSFVLHLGSFVGSGPSRPEEYFALAAESYTSFGYGDIVPEGWLRFVVSVAPLIGLLLLAWSGAFLYAIIHKRALD